jgi:hypothetical protein
MNQILPAYLEWADEEIRITGHRISLFQVIDSILDGVPLDRMIEMLPSVSPDRLREVVGYCNANADWARSYHAERLARYSGMAAGYATEGPSLTELRQRQAGSLRTKEAT